MWCQGPGILHNLSWLTLWRVTTVWVNNIFTDAEHIFPERLQLFPLTLHRNREFLLNPTYDVKLCSIKDVVNFLLPNFIVSASHEIVYCTTPSFPIEQICYMYVDITLLVQWCILHMVRKCNLLLPLQTNSNSPFHRKYQDIKLVEMWQSDIPLLNIYKRRSLARAPRNVTIGSVKKFLTF